MDIKELINNGKILKDDHVKVRNYDNKLIIKERQNKLVNLDKIREEKRFLDIAILNGVKINRLIDIQFYNGKTFVIYEYQKILSEKFDYYKIGENLKIFHSISKLSTFNFNKLSIPDLKIFDGLENIVGQNLFEKWIKKAQIYINSYNNSIKGKLFDTVIHFDLILTNIIKPYFLIDTEQLQYGVVNHDIGSIMRLGYRNHKYDIIKEIGKGYGKKFDIETYEPYMNLKDTTNMLWLYKNNKGILERITELKSRIENIDNYNFKWTVF